MDAVNKIVFTTTVSHVERIIFATIAVLFVAFMYYFQNEDVKKKKKGESGAIASSRRTQKSKQHVDETERVGDVVVKEWTITRVQHAYIHKIANKFNVDVSWVVSRLIVQANKEDNKRKKFIFRVIRCDNCTQSSTGGYKVQIKLALKALHTKWLHNVCKKCSHASVDKTLRILLDFYIGVVLKDGEMEHLFFGGTGEK